MYMPKPGEAHQRLAKFVGEWTVEETLHPSPWDPEGGKAQGHSVSRLGCDGFFVITDYEQLRGGQVTFRGHGVYGWDAEAQQYTMHWFDSMGIDPGPPAKGTWEGDTLTFSSRTQHGHSRYVYTFESSDRFTFAIQHSEDGDAWATFMDSVYTRA